MISGRSTSIPNWSTMYAASSAERAMFFGASGSIAGGQMYAGGSAVRARDVRAPVEDRRVVGGERRARGSRAPRGSASRGRCGSARSSGRRARAACSIIPAGCGSWTITKSYSPSSASAFIAVVAAEDLLLLVGQPGRGALERVVDRLRDVEELVLAVDDLPLGVEPGVAHERDERVEDLRHAAAERGGREMEDALARQAAPPSVRIWSMSAAARDRRVVPERLVADVDRLQLHGGGGYRARRRALRSRYLVKRRREPPVVRTRSRARP